MLQPTQPDPGNETDLGAVRAQRQAPAPALSLDPSWRAGRKLAEARRQLGWTLEHVADRIRIRREFLEALEEMNVKLLPGKAYALAFLRSYARELGIDERAIVDQFQDECALSREDAQKPIRAPSSRPQRRQPWLIAAGFVLLAVALVAWRAFETSRNSDQVAEAPVVSRSGVSNPSDTRPHQRRIVEVRALADSWLEARGPDGTVFLSQNLRAGEVYRPDASPGWTLHAQDGGAFELFVDGVPAGALGSPGMPVLGRPIDGIRPPSEAAAPSPPRS